MSEESKKIIKQNFGVDCDNYDAKELSIILDKILVSLNAQIKELEIKNNELKQKIYMLEENL